MDDGSHRARPLDELAGMMSGQGCPPVSGRSPESVDLSRETVRALRRRPASLGRVRGALGGIRPGCACATCATCVPREMVLVAQSFASYTNGSGPCATCATKFRTFYREERLRTSHLVTFLFLVAQVAQERESLIYEGKRRATRALPRGTHVAQVAHPALASPACRPAAHQPSCLLRPGGRTGPGVGGAFERGTALRPDRSRHRSRPIDGRRSSGR